MAHTPQANPRREFLRLFRTMTDRHHAWRVFSDFCEATACALANGVLPPLGAHDEQHAAREARYERVVATYAPEGKDVMARLLAWTVVGLSEEPTPDFLGALFMELELGSHWHGQFFTPMELARAMARLTLGDGAQVREAIEARGFIRVGEPAAGAGAMVLALATEMRAMGFNPQQQLYVEAVDADPTAAHMAYIQLSLAGIPATVVLGNSLSLETREVFHTPMYWIRGWNWRLRRAAHKVEAAPPAEPMERKPGEQLRLV